ncbi:MAG: imidazoleglycerol-phosphate dehydratase [Micavibrio sp.]|nr:imidazoleglycerol-phosphate dehydratase [Micavibrio sp.]
MRTREQVKRTAKLTRNTHETKVSLEVNLEGEGTYNVSTGIGFFDHMLEQLAKHALLDLNIKAEGDLHIDAHHTAEDVGITLGQALKEAIGDKKGIRRYGHFDLVMDEARITCALDLSNRPYLKWDVNFTVDKLGEMDTELFQEFFHALAGNAGITLHITQLAGTNNHHIIEAAFKAFAKALRMALETDPRAANQLPSTKGAL